MDNFAADSEYRTFSNPSTEAEKTAPPSRYRTKDPEKLARSQARAEARRTRRTLRLQQQQREQEQRRLENANAETHYKISYSSSSDDSSVDENYEVASIAESIPENLTWRGRMQNALHNHWFHLAIVILVSLDAFIVIFELLLDVGAFNNVLCEGNGFLARAEDCHYRTRTRDDITCGAHARMILERANITPSPGAYGANSEICGCDFRQGRRECVPFGAPHGVNPAIVLHGFSIAILSTFVIEVLLKLIAFRLKYFTHKFEVFDGMIVMISFILDVASIVQEEAFEAASLLIVLRLWRVVRVVNGAVLSSKAQSDRDLENIRNEARRIIHAFHKAQDRMDDLEAENIKLKKADSHKK